LRQRTTTIRTQLEHHQVWLYSIAILLGLLIGTRLPEVTAHWEMLLWPALGLLLYATFTQIPLTRLSTALRDGRFLTALLLGNFVLIPLIVGLVTALIPMEPALRLGVLLVLLVPCTDWFITFTHLGGGDAQRAIGATPIILLAQLLLLPVYLWLFMGEQAIELATSRPLLLAFAGLIVVPLLLAWITERATERNAGGASIIRRLGALPVPLLAIVVFLIAGSQVALITDLGTTLWPVALMFVAYLLMAAGLGKLLGRAFQLSVPSARTLVFSLGTRNSFVILPLALALPDIWAAVVVVIVLQSLVELFGMMFYLAFMPHFLKVTDL
jgi:arsenite transporter